MRNLSYWCIIFAAIMPYLFIIIAKAQKGYVKNHNHAPRIYLKNLSGYRARAHWASQNSFEALPFFIAAILAANLLGSVHFSTLNTLAVSFIIARLVYGFCYILDFATLRSFVWLIALIINLTIMIMAI
ncbi:MAPEG family protein [Thiotrichales bacterium 19S9-12]|nr:MAPEG family protein [Thiotrichales bacterium 19S9-11]MCF6811306.1 MAPEG family protein [Thiotrichales bacterium 19S9-12]